MKIANPSSILPLALTVLITPLLSVSQADAQSPSSVPAPDIGKGPLVIDDFWRLIDHSGASGAEPDAQVEKLRASLMRLTPDQIAQFDQLFQQVMRSSYSWDLWGAAYVANGGASDDSFEYFRCWLIARGRRVFEQVSADPDSLADVLAPSAGGDLEFEELAYVAREAWAAKSGRNGTEMPEAVGSTSSSEPSGVPFEEDEAALARRYPKLWKRFGN